MQKLGAATRSESERLLLTLQDYDQFQVVMHDNPDPDAIAAGWGIEILIRERLQRPVRLVGGGAIVRAENRHMVELLQPPIEFVDSLEPADDTATILVDCGAEATNHLLTRCGIRPVAIVDHHIVGVESAVVPYQDIRPEVAASATIVASYLRQQGIDPGPKLATAMMYAIRTETCGYQTDYSELDRQILPWLTEQCEPSLLAEIENAPLPRDYFGDLSLALQATFLYGDVGICILPRATGAELVGEVADLLIRCDCVHAVLCAATVGDDLLLSARTKRGHGSAAHLLMETLDGMGGAGGHDHRAGGKIPNVRPGSRFSRNLHVQLRDRWLTACGAKSRKRTRLIAKHEIFEHLED